MSNVKETLNCLKRSLGDASVRFIRGDIDTVIPCQRAIDAADALLSLGAVATIDVIAGLAHQIDQRVAVALVERIRGGVERPVAMASPN